MTSETSLKLKREFHQLKLTVFSQSNNYLDLSVVNPDLQPEKQIIDKLLEFSLQNNAHRYSSAQGLPELRQAIAERYLNRYKVKINWEEEVTIARGTNAGIANILNLFYKKYSRKPKVLLPTPTYSMHLELTKQRASCGSFYSLDQKETELLSSLIEQTKKEEIDILLMNFPNNPTGKIVSKEFYDSLLAEFSNTNVWIINDFVYADLAFSEAKTPSILASNQNNLLFEIFSLSKSHSLAGWRIAMLLGSAELIREITQTQTEIDYGSYQGFQRAIAFALTSEQDFSKKTSDTYCQRAKLLSSKLKISGIEIKSDDSGCFLWCKLPTALQQNSYEFCKELLIKQKIAIQPGEIFGDNLERYFRISLTTNEALLSSAAERINNQLSDLA